MAPLKRTKDLNGNTLNIMETLKLEELAPYLSYCLKVRFHNDRIEEIYGITQSQVFIYGMGWLNFNEFKPILRPLRDILTIPDIMVHFEDMAVSIIPRIKLKSALEISELFITDPDRLNSYFRYNFWQELAKQHIDYQGLIDRGLALSLHDIKQEGR